MIYLDNAATTKIRPEVLGVMMPYLTEVYGNAGSIHKAGRDALKAIEKARQQVADFIGAKPEQIIFTSGGSEANNLAVLGIKDYLESINKKHIIVSNVEHESMLKAINAISKPLGDNKKMCIKGEFYAQFLKVNGDGFVNPDDLRDMLRADTGLVSVMRVNNETGVLNPIKEIAKLCKENNTLFLSDCVQAAGCCEINVEELGCDFLTISSHKIYGPKGVGALYIRDKNLLSSLIHGGTSQEFGLRGGTENVAGIVGFGEACKLIKKEPDVYSKTPQFCKSHFYKQLNKHLQDKGLNSAVKINGNSESNSGRILNLLIDGVDGETLVLALDSNGVCISAGSACTSHESKPSHVLTAMGLTDEQARSSIRVSFSEFITVKEIDDAAMIMANCISALKAGV